MSSDLQKQFKQILTDAEKQIEAEILFQSLSILNKILTNIANDPMEPKFRILKKQNPTLIRKLFSIPQVLKVLLEIGFLENDDFYTFPDNKIGNIYEIMNSLKGWFQLIDFKRQNLIQQYNSLKNLILEDKYIDKHQKTQMCTYCKQKNILLFTCSCEKPKYCSKQCKDNHSQFHYERCPTIALEQEKIAQQLIQIPESKNGVCGLSNLGNTCYMNSGLQCLSNCGDFAKYFIEGSFDMDFNLIQEKDSQQQQNAEKIQYLSKSFQILLKHLHYGQQPVFSPIGFKQLLGNLHPIFKGYNQNDSQEFVNIVLQQINEELNKYEKNQMIEQNFEGVLESVIYCFTCNKEFKQKEKFNMLSLPIPENQQNLSLNDCLLEFFKQEILEGENCYFCSNCDKLVEKAQKQINILKYPQNLIFHFKRFDKTIVEKQLQIQIQQNFQQKEKKEKENKMEIEVINNNNQEKIENKQEEEEEEEENEEEIKKKQQQNKVFELQIVKKENLIDFPIQNLILEDKQNINNTYDLQSVSNHYGRYSGGHYTAVSFNQFYKQWFNYNDNQVTQIKQNQIKQEIVTQAAYLLFYHKK